jgi:class 3 adenylate cyclase
VGLALQLADLVCQLAGPGEVLATYDSARMAGTLPEILVEERGPVRLRGLENPVRVVGVAADFNR